MPDARAPPARDDMRRADENEWRLAHAAPTFRQSCLLFRPAAPGDNAIGINVMRPVVRSCARLIL